MNAMPGENSVTPESNKEGRQAEKAEESEDLRCGYFKCKPDCLQRCNTPRWLLASVCWFTFTQSFITSGVNPVNLSTLERRFDLPSSSVAWIPSSYDFSAAILAIFCGYVGTYVHKGILLTIGAYVMALGSFIMFLPHALAGEYKLGTSVTDMCDRSGNSTRCDGDDSGVSHYLAFFVIGNLLIGFGGAAVYTVSVPYLDASIKTRDLALYIGCMLAASAVGPALGFVFGGLFLDIYVDVGRVSMDEVTIEPDDPRWVGAWWIAYLCTSVASLTVGLFVCCFPRELPAAKAQRAAKVSEVHKGRDSGSDEKPSRSCMSTVQTLKHFFTNPVFVFCAIGAAVMSGAVTAFAAFLPKVLELHFHLTSSEAGIFTGIVIVPGAACGQLFGGLVPKWLNLKVRGLLIQVTVCMLICLSCSALFLIKCDAAAMAGVTVPYMNSTEELPDVDLLHPCNENCSCTTRSYDPICGVDGAEYFSPCYAGCLEKTENDEEVYYNCSCIGAPTQGDILQAGYATGGTCKADCSWLPLFLCLLLLLMFVAFMANTAGHAAVFRSIPEKDRTLGAGVQGAIGRLLGAAPAPLIFGAIFDTACQVWQRNCDQKGSCWLYDTDFMARGLAASLAIMSAIAVTSFALAAILYKAPPVDSNTDAKNAVDGKCGKNDTAISPATTISDGNLNPTAPTQMEDSPSQNENNETVATSL